MAVYRPNLSPSEAMNRIVQARHLYPAQAIQLSSHLLGFAAYGRSNGQVPGMLATHILPNNVIFLGARCCSSAKDLWSKKCVPCDSKDIRPMIEQSAQELLPKIPEWDLVNESGVLKLQRSWKVKSFVKGLEFFQAVATVAETEGHHPDLHLVGWNNVKLDVWTHSVGGLTENDFILAAKISSLDLQHLLRRKASKSSRDPGNE